MQRQAASRYIPHCLWSIPVQLSQAGRALAQAEPLIAAAGLSMTAGDTLVPTKTTLAAVDGRFGDQRSISPTSLKI